MAHAINKTRATELSKTSSGCSYWRRNVDFPNETTADQFFDEEQLEAYRELGMAIAQEAIATLKSERDVQNRPAQALRTAFGWSTPMGQ